MTVARLVIAASVALSWVGSLLALYQACRNAVPEPTEPPHETR